MSPGPTRQTTAGARDRDLQNLARRTGPPTDELLQLYALEGFLERLGASPHASRFVLKGGVLLAAYDSRRPTRDVDFAGVCLRNDADEIQSGSARSSGSPWAMAWCSTREPRRLR